VTSRVRAVIRKELREYRRNRFVVGSMVALPLVFLGIPTANILALKADMDATTIRAVVGGAMVTFFFVALILPTVISGYAVIGEREQGTLEPVLTTPVAQEELLLGKALAAVVPTVAIAYALFLVFALAVKAAAIPQVVDLVWQPSQLVAIVLFAPLLATFSIWVGLAMSVRANDVRVAQQLSGLAMLPMIGLISLFTFRVIAPSVTVAVAGGVVVALIDMIAWRLVSRMFDRERLLTRYGRG
jgi:ABC-type Na+ efflux pump permease subunit